MLSFITPKGTLVYVSYTDDCADNTGGFYCEVEKECGTDDDSLLVYYDNFVIHKDDIKGYEGTKLYDILEELTEEYIKSVDY